MKTENSNQANLQMTCSNGNVAAYETWNGGRTKLYLASEDGQEAVDKFIEEAHDSNRLSTLHIYGDEDLAIDEYYYERPHEEEE